MPTAPPRSARRAAALGCALILASTLAACSGSPGTDDSPPTAAETATANADETTQTTETPSPPKESGETSADGGASDEGAAQGPEIVPADEFGDCAVDFFEATIDPFDAQMVADWRSEPELAGLEGLASAFDAACIHFLATTATTHYLVLSANALDATTLGAALSDPSNTATGWSEGPPAVAPVLAAWSRVHPAPGSQFEVTAVQLLDAQGYVANQLFGSMPNRVPDMSQWPTLLRLDTSLS